MTDLTPLQVYYTILDDDNHVAFHLPSQRALDLLSTERQSAVAQARKSSLDEQSVSDRQRQRQAALKRINARQEPLREEKEIRRQLLENADLVSKLTEHAKKGKSEIARKGVRDTHKAGNLMGGEYGFISGEHQMPMVEQKQYEKEYWEEGGVAERQAIHSAKAVLNDMNVLTPKGQMRMRDVDTAADDDYHDNETQRQKENMVMDLLRKGGPDMEEALDPSHDQTTRNCALYIALDISYSMNCSDSFDQALVGIDRFLSQFLPLFRSGKLFPFRDGCSPRQLNENNYSRVLRSAPRDGLTSFVNVLNSISQSISQEEPNRDVVIWFLSDGYCTDGDEEFYQCTSRLKHYFTNMCTKRAITFHTIGFDHPMVEPLVLVSNLGNRKGTYQFAESMALFATQTMSDIMETTVVQNRATTDAYAISYVTDNKYPGRREYIRFTDEITVVQPTEQMRHCLFDVRPGQYSDNNGKMPFQSGWIPPPVSFVVSGNYFPHKVQFVHVEDPYVLLMCSMNHIETELIDIMNRLAITQDRAFLHPIKNETAKVDVTSLDQKITDFSKDPRSSQLHGESKATVGDRISYMKELISNLFQALRHGIKLYKGASEGHSLFRAREVGLAKLLSNCYAGLTRRRLSKKLSKRVLQNRNLLDELAFETRQLRPTIPFDELYSITPRASLEFFQCGFSLNNWAESLQQGSAIFLGINMSRSQAAVADPCQVKIHHIATTLISSDDFLRFTAQALAQDNATTRSKQCNEKLGEAVHGGFSRTRTGAAIVKGLAREEINGAIPLFIHREHWKIARLVSRPILAWMTTTDVFGFHMLQTTQLPLMCLFKFLDLGDTTVSEFHGRAFFQMIRTCMQVFDENRMRVLDYEQPRNRLHDVVPSTRILLAKMLLDPNPCDIRRRVLQVLEEEIRRFFRAKKISDNAIVERLAKRLHCDNLVSINDSHASPAVVHELPLEMKYLSRPYNHEEARSLEHMINRHAGKSMAILCRFAQLYAFFEGIQMDAFAAEMDINGGIAPDRLVQEYCELMNRNCEKHKATLEDLITTLNTLHLQTTPSANSVVKKERGTPPISLTTKQINGLVVQCAMHRRNADRRKAIEMLGEQLLHPLFSQADAHMVLDNFVRDCHSAQVGRIVSTCRAAYNVAHKLRESLNPFCKMFFRQRTAREIKYTLENGVFKGQKLDIDAPHCVTENPMTICLSTKRWDLFSLLLRFKANPCKELFKGRNVMFYAVRAFRKSAGDMPAKPLLELLDADANCIFCITNRERPLHVLLAELGLSEDLDQVQGNAPISTKKRDSILDHIRDALHRYEYDRLEREEAEKEQRQSQLQLRLKSVASQSRKTNPRRSNHV